ncbi:MAG: histidinol-phosphatase HisJ family protein [Lachnospiraceae bacterium]|nr:histidinol-phosphatase HisJ family protein [Lachnospiraceae bacterium]
MIQLSKNAMFHVHTYRCKHATGTDREYIERAIELGADEIWFTDHAPYPGDKIGKRMLYADLPEYVETMKALKKEYAREIDLKIGLEMEYLPSYDSYIKSVRRSGDFDVLMLGEHFYERADGSVYFAKEELGDDIMNERFGMCEGMVAGIKTGCFDVVAHPDRIFRNCRNWTPEMAELSQRIIDAVRGTDIYLEQNYSSTIKKDHYWTEFWDMVPKDVHVLKGLDAHKVEALMKLDFEFKATH